ncbi:MAG: phosphoribosylanthranilate isomerase [Pseudomonadota bacterium]|nr:phosphoribosylanthranilate isomerase [Pseudomonadota bacterium]
MKIKICGLNPARDVQTCIDQNIFMLGFVFYKQSPRNIDLKEINTLKNYNRKSSLYVSVCVNPTNEFIKKNILGNFDYIQLHGSETIKQVKEIKNMGIKVIKAIKIKDHKDIPLYKDYENIADLILFDSISMEKSQSIPKDLLSKLPKGEKFGLAGAINLKNIREYSQLGFDFLDLSSGLERENLKGYKDHLKIKNFMNKINELKN